MSRPAKYASQPNRPPGYAESERTRARNAYRRRQGIPLDAPLRETGAGRWRDREHECIRCTEPHAPGSELCWDHQRIMAELAKEEAEG